ncbi:MAG: hypothetical protein CVU56_03925 [Deltaproteobacteria bacterium HGW-Deltaproteobacteria-14]|jgi:hypothetical protein|nr:MAG: hypothetical protein CVU56_03925 [Deltaproteobacteria bacterium HGW-Deltaproteobacteria-14]
MTRTLLWLAVCGALLAGLAACGDDAAAGGDADAVDTAEEVSDGADSDADADAAPDAVDTLASDTASPAWAVPPLVDPAIVTPAGAQLSVQPTLAIGADRSVLVAWTGQVGDKLVIYRALRWPDGTEAADPIQVNTDPRGVHNEPAACALSGGGYVIAWSVDTKEVAPDGGGNLEVHFRRYFADARPQDGADVNVATGVAGNHWLADVACDADGGFVIAGVRPGDAPGFSVFFQRYDAEGAVVGAATTALPSATASQAFPAVAVDATGAVIASWEDAADSAADTRVVLRRFSADGAPSEVLGVAAAPGVDASGAAVAADPRTPSFAVAANLGTTIQLSVLADIDSTPAPVSGPDLATAKTYQPALAALGDDRFAAVWFTGSGAAVSARLGTFGAAGFDGDATLATGSFPLAYRPAVAYGRGVLAAAWTESLGGGQYAVRVAVFAAPSE